MAARPHGYYCAVCPFSSGGEIIQKKKNPYADYDPCPRPMDWARVITLESILLKIFESDEIIHLFHLALLAVGDSIRH